MLNIAPIKLLSGSHSDTGTTGSGCFMNVIAYLNGEPQITDQSPCVCVSVRPIAIWANDFMRDSERARLIPYIERAMGSATSDTAEMIRRAWLAADFGALMAKYAAESAESAEYAAKSAKSAKYAAEYAKYAAEYAAKSAKYAAASAASAAESVSRREEIIVAALALLDAMLPPAQPAGADVAARACELVVLAQRSAVAAS